MIPIVVLILALSTPCLAGEIDIRPLLGSGDYETAFNLLLNAADSIEVDENILYYLCITAPAGKYASVYLKEYTQKYPNGKHIAEIRQKLCDYYSSQGMDITAGKLYSKTPDINTRTAPEVYKLALAKQRAGEYDSASDIYRQLLLADIAEIESWAMLGLADCDLLSGKSEKAARAYEEIINLGTGSAVYPLALLGLSEANRRAGNPKEARLRYGAYRKAFPQAPPVVELEAIEPESAPAYKPPKIPSSINVGYYVQVGVFGKKDNAKTCLRKFRNLGYQAKTEEFVEGGQKFQRVMIGPFRDEDSARKTKDDLEKSQGEKYLIFVQ